MNKNNKKFNISKLIIMYLVFSLLFANEFYFYNIVYASNNESTTKKRKVIGHKIEGAEYYEEIWDKYSVIAVDNGGSSGEGGGAGDNSALEAGNDGEGNESGGIMGDAVGVGTGSGNSQNVEGTGGGTSGNLDGKGGASQNNTNGNLGNYGNISSNSSNYGSSGSDIADALRALKQEIDESRAESLAKILETALDAKRIEESIKERESIQDSIQKELVKESIKAKVANQEIQHETPFFVPQNNNNKKQNVFENTEAPTANENDIKMKNIYDFNNNETTNPRVGAVNIVKGEVNNSSFEETILAPTSDPFDNTIAPEENMETVSTEEFFDAPQVFESEISANEQNDSAETTGTEDLIQENERKEGESGEVAGDNEDSNEKNDDDDGKGSKGGSDAEADEDKSGEDGANESVGHAEDKGKFQMNNNGEFSGKKIFELKTTGNLGINNENNSLVNLKLIMMLFTSTLLVLGAVGFLHTTRDVKRKNNYF